MTRIDDRHRSDGISNRRVWQLAVHGVHAVCCISSKLSSTKENLQIVSMQMTIPQKRISQNTHNILINECQKGTYFIVVNEEILKHYDFLNKLLLFCNILLPHKLKPTIIIIKYNIGCEINDVFFSLAFIFNSWSSDAQIDFNLCQKCDPLSALWKQALKITLIYQEDTRRFLLAF